MRIEKVLVPVDFSPASRQALNYGIAFARKFRARLTLLHVLESPEEQHVAQARRMLSALVAPEDQDDLDLETVVKSGKVEDEIASTVREQHADLAVMGTHGRRLIDRLLVGSVTLGMLRKLEVPILTVSRAAPPLSFERILFATDLSEASISVSDFVVDLARIANSRVTFLHAVEKGGLVKETPMGAYINPDHVEEARAKLDELAIEDSQRNVRIDVALVEGVPAEAILKTAEEICADLIVIKAKHKGLLERTLLGSTAERVVREAQVPILSIPANIEQLGQRPAA